MYAVLAEGESDYLTLAAIVKRLYLLSKPDAANIRVGGRSFDGGAKLLKHGGEHLKALHATGNWSRYIVCHDADRESTEDRREQIKEKIILPSRVLATVCTVVPVQELESWIIADINCMTNIFKRWKPVKEVEHPEFLDDPKEYLERVCKGNGSPRYSSSFNHRIAEYLDLEKVQRKCPSFSPLIDLFKKKKSI